MLVISADLHRDLQAERFERFVLTSPFLGAEVHSNCSLHHFDHLLGVGTSVFSFCDILPKTLLDMSALTAGLVV